MKAFLRYRILFAVAAAAAVVAPTWARAAEPTADECLAASEKWIALRGQHRLLEARSALLVCASTSCPGEVRDECAQRIGEINASIPTVVFEAKDAGGNDLSAVRVTMDGRPLLDRLEGASTAIDPGEHTFVFETAGQPSAQKKIMIVEGARDRHESI